MGSCCIREAFPGSDTKNSPQAENYERKQSTFPSVQAERSQKPRRSQTSATSQKPRRMTSQSTNSQDATFPLLTRHLKQKFSQLYDGKTDHRESFGLVTKKESKVTVWMKKLPRAPGKLTENELLKDFAELTRLSHPCILQVDTVLFNSKEIYVLSENFTGAQVVNYTEIAGKQSESMVKNIAKQLLRLINYLHTQKIVLKTLSLHTLLFYLSGSEDIRVKSLGIGGWKSSEKPIRHDIRLNPLLYKAPERYQSDVMDVKSEIWSCGMILLVLLTNTVPVIGENAANIQSTVENGVDFSQKVWFKFDLRARSLIASMLATDPALRPTAAECLAHPWLQETQAVVPPALFPAMTNLRRFKPGSPLQLAVLTYIVTHALTPADKQTSQELFEYINTSGSGVLSPTELQQVFSQVSRTEFSEFLTSKVFRAVDIKGNGVIDFTEFLIASNIRSNLTNTLCLKAAFNLLDCDGLGSIDASQLPTAFNYSNAQELMELVREVTEDGEGLLKYREFARLVKLIMKETK